MTKFSCYGCEKRAPGCHAKCDIYKAEKAEHEERKAKENRRRSVKNGLNAQRSAAVYRNTKGKRKGYTHGTEDY